MRARQLAYVGGAVLGVITLTLVGWFPIAKADKQHHRVAFTVDPLWPKPLPAPIGKDGIAHTWVQGEVAGNCIDMRDNVYTFNRGWEVGATVNGTLQGNESGAVVGQDATSSAIPSPPVVAFDRDGNAIAGWGNPSLFPATQVDGGFAAYLPHGAHGCFI